MRALESAASTARPADRRAVVPRYSSSRARNPVLLLRPAWSWVDALEGDRGLAIQLAARADQVVIVPVEGVMPDFDTERDVDRR